MKPTFRFFTLSRSGDCGIAFFLAVSQTGTAFVFGLLKGRDRACL
ncbi:MAG: hypothetical protein RID09_03605 [Coleofasciculus sp. G1-WW12-02]